MTAELSWHVQNYKLIVPPEEKKEELFSQELNDELINGLWDG